MTTKDLIGVIDLDYESEIHHPTTGKLVGRYSLRRVITDFLR